MSATSVKLPWRMQPATAVARTALQGARIDHFSYFITFYSIILGLAVTELLGGFARMVRARALRKLEPQTALLALLTLVLVIVTWLDARDSLQSVSMDFEGLGAPIAMAIFYYLGAAVVFPHDEADHERLADYYVSRKRFIVGMLLVANLLDELIFIRHFKDMLAHKPMLFWLWALPYNIVIDAGLLALLLVRSRRVNIVMLVVMILVMVVPYSGSGGIRGAIAQHYGYSAD
jgi:hypothetical protein